MRRGGKSAHKLHTGVVATVVACLVVGIATLGNAERVSDSHGPTARELEDALAASIHITPKTGTSGVGPDTPVVVTSDLGHLTDVSVTSSSGGVVQGTWDDAGNDWKSRGLLLYGHAYRVTATVTGAANLLAQKTATFRTLIPRDTVTASVWPTTGLTVGVGQPIVFTFSQPIPVEARASLERHLLVAGKPQVAGGWHWFNDHELHFRPKSLWPAGAHVTVLWSLSGWYAGDDVWGDGRGSSAFTIGDAHVSIADLATFTMTVTDNGHVVATYPMSGGKPTDPTMGGTHIVLDRASVVRMSSVDQRRTGQLARRLRRGGVRRRAHLRQRRIRTRRALVDRAAREIRTSPTAAST